MATSVGEADALYKRAPVEAVVLPRLRSVRVEGCSASRVALALVFFAAVVAAFIVLVSVTCVHCIFMHTTTTGRAHHCRRHGVDEGQHLARGRALCGA